MGDLAKNERRNRIINKALSDLDLIINCHDPEIDTSINNMVWDRLSKMGSDLEQMARDDALEEAAKLVADRESACTQWHRDTGGHANVYGQLSAAAGYIRALKGERNES